MDKIIGDGRRMIDTDKYEGHTPRPWLATHDLVETEAKYGGTFTHIINHDGWRVWVGKKDADVPHLQNNRSGSENLNEADARLIADAPLLLEEVKRLRKELDLYKTRYLKMTEGMDWQEENEMWSDEE
tara:strand:+ start:374 stop:757 length:384 start_codon:yes stop_codon:yes gene_type:complete